MHRKPMPKHGLSCVIRRVIKQLRHSSAQTAIPIYCVAFLAKGAAISCGKRLVAMHIISRSVLTDLFANPQRVIKSEWLGCKYFDRA